MESPSTWNLLTSAIAVAGLDDLDRTWGFLVFLGLVGNRGDIREHFVDACRVIQREGEITGPSRASRVAWRFSTRHWLDVLVLVNQPDPDATIARVQHAQFLAAGAPVPDVIRSTGDVFCRHCGQRTSLLYPCHHCKQAPLDTLALAIELGLSDEALQQCRHCARVHTGEKYCYFCGAPQ